MNIVEDKFVFILYKDGVNIAKLLRGKLATAGAQMVFLKDGGHV